jgi:UDP-glucose 4-epimerase
MRIVVVGATGNVGTAVLRRLQREPGVEIVGVARRVPGAGAPFPYSGVAWQAVDVGDPDASDRLAAAFAGADAVIHLAWRLQPNHRERQLVATNVGGLKAVLVAVAAARVPQVVVASSVGAYSPGPKRRRVDESWPTGGIASSHYARQKSVNERRLDDFESGNPDVVVTRIRPGLVMQGSAGADLARIFVGPRVPTWWLSRVRLPFLPVPPRAVTQVVHADDLADAFWRVVERRTGGAFNLAGEPVIGPRELAEVLRTRWLPVRIAPLRGLMWLAWHLRLIAPDPGWLDIATSVPVMSTARAREVLGWRPTVDARDALREVIEGVAARSAAAGSPHLSARPEPASRP